MSEQKDFIMVSSVRIFKSAGEQYAGLRSYIRLADTAKSHLNRCFPPDVIWNSTCQTMLDKHIDNGDDIVIEVRVYGQENANN